MAGRATNLPAIHINQVTKRAFIDQPTTLLANGCTRIAAFHGAVSPAVFFAGFS